VHILGFSGSLYKRSIVQENESLIGKVVKIDLQTDKGSRGQFAWFAVQVNLSKPLISKIWITSRIHRIEYESLPSICIQHGRFGHLREGKGWKKKSLKSGWWLIVGNNRKQWDQADFLENNNGDRNSKDKAKSSDNSRIEITRNKILKEKGIKVSNKSKKQKQLINGPMGVKLGIQKDRSGSGSGSRDVGSKIGSGKRIGGIKWACFT
ncbi:hypothetical protein Goarm_010810, partial [Gossypium armourianum]|nr:hypothetical protein [Gossypium armourianum]